MLFIAYGCDIYGHNCLDFIAGKGESLKSLLGYMKKTAILPIIKSSLVIIIITMQLKMLSMFTLFYSLYFLLFNPKKEKCEKL